MIEITFRLVEMALDSLKERWEAYKWYVDVVDGHDIEGLANLFKSYPKESGKPHLIIANTTKGKGISFIENKAEWHHKVPTEEQLKTAIKELEACK